MKSPYVSELQVNQQVTGVFLVHSKEIRQKKNGDLYLSLVLGDRTGEVDAKMWDNIAEVMDTFDRDDFVRVRGVLNTYQGRPQFSIHKLQRVDESEVDIADFFPLSARDVEEMAAELKAVISGVGNPHLKRLLEEIFNDPEIASRFSRAPAAKTVHHAYLGGLLEHVLSLVKLCRLVASHYPEIDADLLVTGALLHDVGKIYELSFDRSFGYTSEGQLLGHIVIGLRIIEEKLRRLPGFPGRLRDLVEHMVLSHHGHLEFGSPKLPMFAEALLLHYLDDMDSKLECVRAQIARDRQGEDDWTGYSPTLERNLLKKNLYLNGTDSPAVEAAPAPPAKRKQKSPTVFGEKLLDALGGARAED